MICQRLNNGYINSDIEQSNNAIIKIFENWVAPHQSPHTNLWSKKSRDSRLIKSNTNEVSPLAPEICITDIHSNTISST